MNFRLAFAMLFSFLGIAESCSQNTPVSGGRTERHEKRAPIKSNDLKELNTSFYIRPRAYMSKFADFYDIKFKPIENNKFKLSCNDNSVVVGADVAKGIQAIIKEYNLESKNGLYSVTAGLPPEYQGMNFKAVYASDEKLSFTENNNPDSAWRIMLFRYVRETLIAHGDTTYVIKDDGQKIERMNLEYSAGDGILYTYDNITAEDGNEHIYREVWDKNADKLVSEVSIPIPAGYYDGMNKLVEELGLAWVANDMRYNQKTDVTKESYCYFYAGNSDFNNLFSSTYRGEEMTDNIKSLISQLRKYMDKPFDEKKPANKPAVRRKRK